MNSKKIYNLIIVSILIISFAFAQAQAQSTASTADFVSYWNLDEGTGTVTADSSGNGNNLELINGPTWIDGKIGKALQFDGMNDYARTGSIASGTSGTIQVWIKPSASYTTNQYVMSSLKSNGADTSARYSIFVRNTDYCESGEWGVSIANGVSHQVICSGQVYDSNNFPSGTWKNLAVTYDGSYVKLYNDGVLIKIAAQKVNGAGKAESFSIGRAGAYPGGYYFKGMIDEVKIINRALSANEIEAEYLNMSDGTTTPASTPTTGVEIGNVNYLSYYTHQNNPELTFDLLSNLEDIRPGTTVAWQVYKQPFDLTDLALVKSRFDMATANKNYNWDYGVFVLDEEVFNPVLYCMWSPSSRGLSTWQIDDTATFAGIEIKLIKPWYIAKYGSWDQGWWDNVKSSNNYNDPIVKEWNAEFTYKIYMAWHQHMRNLGKKSAIIGLVGVRDVDISSAFETYYFPSPSWEYVMANYDLVFTYMYPRTLSEVVRSETLVMDLREEYNYQGKIAHILTTKFSDGIGSTDQTISQEEFNRVYPYVDYITGYPYMDVSNWNDPTIPYASALIKFQEDHI